MEVITTLVQSDLRKVPADAQRIESPFTGFAAG